MFRKPLEHCQRCRMNCKMLWNLFQLLLESLESHKLEIPPKSNKNRSFSSIIRLARADKQTFRHYPSSFTNILLEKLERRANNRQEEDKHSRRENSSARRNPQLLDVSFSCFFRGFRRILMTSPFCRAEGCSGCETTTRRRRMATAFRKHFQLLSDSTS